METPMEYTPETVRAARERLRQGATVAEVAGMPRETVEAAYALAYSLYAASNYKDAETVFRVLCLWNHKEARFWMGLAGSMQKNGDLRNAVKCYIHAMYAGGGKDSAPLVHAAMCLLKLGDRKEALDLFADALLFGDPENAANAVYHGKARAMLDLLRKEGGPGAGESAT